MPPHISRRSKFDTNNLAKGGLKVKRANLPYYSQPFNNTGSSSFTVPSYLPGTGEQGVLDFNMGLTKNIIGELLPGLIGNTNESVAQYSVPTFSNLPSTAVPKYVDGFDNLKGMFPSEDFAGRTYDRPNFTAAPAFNNSFYYDSPASRRSEFYKTRAITPDVLSDPSFRAFEDSLNVATAKSSRNIADDMARRGILSSGATKEAFEELNQGNARAIAGELGSIASPLITESLLEQNIRQPIRQTEFDARQDALELDRRRYDAERRTAFNERQDLQRYNALLNDAERRTSFDVKNSLVEMGANQERLNRLISFGEKDTAARRLNEGNLAALNRDDFNRYQAYRKEEANLGVMNQALRDENIGRRISLINSLLTGQQPMIGAGLESLGLQQRQQQAQSSFNAQRYNSDNNLTGSLINTGARMAPTVVDWLGALLESA